MWWARLCVSSFCTESQRLRNSLVHLRHNKFPFQYVSQSKPNRLCRLRLLRLVDVGIEVMSGRYSSNVFHPLAFGFFFCSLWLLLLCSLWLLLLDERYMMANNFRQTRTFDDSSSMYQSTLFVPAERRIGFYVGYDAFGLLAFFAPLQRVQIFFFNAFFIGCFLANFGSFFFEFGFHRASVNQVFV